MGEMYTQATNASLLMTGNLLSWSTPTAYSHLFIILSSSTAHHCLASVFFMIKKKKIKTLNPSYFSKKKSTYQSQLNTVLEINNSVTDD